MRYEWNTDVLRATGVMVLLEGDLALLAERDESVADLVSLLKDHAAS